MEVDTTRFGTLVVDENAVITFTQPIIGFPELRRFVLLPGASNSAVKWLQSIDSREMAFLVVDPRTVYPNYEVELRPEELAELAAERVAQLEVYTLVVVPADNTQVRTNLKAPILINLRQRLAKQAVMERKDYPIQYFLAQTQAASGSSGGGDSVQEAAHARADT